MKKLVTMSKRFTKIFVVSIFVLACAALLPAAKVQATGQVNFKISTDAFSEIPGVVGIQLDSSAPTQIILAASGDNAFTPPAVETVVTGWFTNCPNGLVIKYGGVATKKNPTDPTKYIFNLSGTPTAAEEALVQVQIPDSYFTNATAVYNNDDNVKWVIINESDLAATVTNCTVDGTVGQPVSVNTFKINMTKGWFTTTDQMGIWMSNGNTFSECINSPAGLNFSPMGSSFSYVNLSVSGTPTEGKVEPFAITIPKELLLYATKDLTVPVNPNAKWNIAGGNNPTTPSSGQSSSLTDNSQSGNGSSSQGNTNQAIFSYAPLKAAGGTPADQKSALTENNDIVITQQGPLAQQAFQERTPAGFQQAFSVDVLTDHEMKFSQKTGIFKVLSIPDEFRKENRNFAVLALDSKGNVTRYTDTDSNPGTITADIDTDAYALSIIYSDTVKLTAEQGTPAASGPDATVYTVHAGDTLSQIAAAHHTTVETIAQNNGITNVNRIHIGQQLKLGS